MSHCTPLSLTYRRTHGDYDMKEEQLSALSDIVDESRRTLHQFVEDLYLVDLQADFVAEAQTVAERISEEAFNLVELLAAAQEEDYD